MLTLATKLLLAPACVVAASLAARRFGTRVGGLIGGLPVVGGPILLVLTLIHGRTFGAHAAAGALLGLAALTAFVVVYGQVSTRRGPLVSVLAGWAAFLAAVALLSPLDVSRGLAVVAAFAAFAVGAALLPPPPERVRAARPPSRVDLPARALAALALVLILSAASGSLGAHVSGLLSPFPIITAVLAVFTHSADGNEEVRTLLRGFLVGFYAYAVFCFVVAATLENSSTAVSFAAAVAASVVTQLAVVGALSRRDTGTAAPVGA